MRFGVPCGQLGSYVVLVGESAEDLFPVDPVLGEVDRLGRAGGCLSWVSWPRERCGLAVL